MTLEIDLSHQPQKTDTNQLELWRFHAIFDQPLKGNGDVQPHKSQAEERALYDKSAKLLHEVEDYADADRKNTLVTLSTPAAAAGARAFLGSRAGWCVFGAMVGWNIYNQYKMNHEIHQIRADLTPDIQKDYKALSQSASTMIDNSSWLGDLGLGSIATSLAMTVPRYGATVGLTAGLFGLAGYKHYWQAAGDNIGRANVEVANAADRLGIAQLTLDQRLVSTVANPNERAAAVQPTAKKTSSPEVSTGHGLGHPTQHDNNYWSDGISNLLRNIGK